MQTETRTNTDYYPEEDEINLLDLLLVLLKHKKLISYIVLFAAIAALIISLLLTNIYRSEATISLRSEDNNSMGSISGLGGLGGMVAGRFGLGGNEVLEKLKITLNSRELTKRVVEKHNLIPKFFEDEWNPEKKKWVDEENIPTIQDTWKLILENLLTIKVNEDSATLTIGFEHEKPAFAKTMVEHYTNELSTMLREEVLFDAGEKQKFFHQQLETITDPLLREKIYTLLAKEIERETFAKAQHYYGFLLIDPPIVPDLDKKIKPKRSIICILSVFVAFFMAIFIAFLVEFINRLKSDDRERYDSIVKEIQFWKKT